MVNMTVYSEVKRLHSFLQDMVGLRRRKRQLQISEPFDFKREATIIPGISEDEISVLREKAAASRLGIAHADTYSDTIFPLPHHHHHHHHHHSHPHRLRSRGSGGALSLSPSGTTITAAAVTAATPPPRLSIPIPIPIPGGGGNSAFSRHGSGSSSLRSSSTVQGYHGQGGLLGVGAGGAERVSSSMDYLDLLLFGNPSGVSHHSHHHHHHEVAGPELVMPPLGPVVLAGSTMTVSPLELDGGELGGGGGGGVDWGMEFEFQMESPVSPLSPASRGKRGL